MAIIATDEQFRETDNLRLKASTGKPIILDFYLNGFSYSQELCFFGSVDKELCFPANLIMTFCHQREHQVSPLAGGKRMSYSKRTPNEIFKSTPSKMCY